MYYHDVVAVVGGGKLIDWSSDFLNSNFKGKSFLKCRDVLHTGNDVEQ